MREAKRARKKNRERATLKSMIAQYFIEEGHIITRDNVYVIKECGNSNKLEVQEKKGSRYMW